MDGSEGVFIIVADLEASIAIAFNNDLSTSTAIAFLLAWDDITIGTSRKTSVKSDLHVPANKEASVMILNYIIAKYFYW